MEKKLEHIGAVNANNRSSGSLLKKIGYGILSGICFLSSPVTGALGVAAGIDFGTAQHSHINIDVDNISKFMKIFSIV